MCQNFNDIVIVTKGQIKKYDIEYVDYINDLLLNIDFRLTQIGFDKDYQLNESGLELQRLYDEIYMQDLEDLTKTANL